VGIDVRKQSHDFLDKDTSVINNNNNELATVEQCDFIFFEYLGILFYSIVNLLRTVRISLFHSLCLLLLYVV